MMASAREGAQRTCSCSGCDKEQKSGRKQEVVQTLEVSDQNLSLIFCRSHRFLVSSTASYQGHLIAQQSAAIVQKKHQISSIIGCCNIVCIRGSQPVVSHFSLNLSKTKISSVFYLPFEDEAVFILYTLCL